jgi:hypothetical protein
MSLLGYVEVFWRSFERPLENVKVFSKSPLGYVEVFWRSFERPLENVKVFCKRPLGYVEVFWRSSKGLWKSSERPLEDLRGKDLLGFGPEIREGGPPSPFLFWDSHIPHFQPLSWPFSPFL